MRRLGLGALVPALLLSACPRSCLFQQVAPLSSAPVETLRPAAPVGPVVSQTPPSPRYPGKGIFGDAIQFVGYDTDPLQPRAGGPVAITFYFHVLKNVDHDWQIFVHADDRAGRVGRINVDHYPAGGALHTDRWKAGQYIADRFTIDLPQALTKDQVDLWSGFYQDDVRLPITDPRECVNDGNNRLLAGTLNIE